MSVLVTAVIQTMADVAAVLPADLPNPDPVQPPGTDGFTAIMGWGKWVALAVAILALFAAGAMMGINSRRGEGGEHVGRIAAILGGVVVISAAVAIVGFLSGA